MTVSSVQTWFYIKTYERNFRQEAHSYPQADICSAPHSDHDDTHALIVCGAPRAYGQAGHLNELARAVMIGWFIIVIAFTNLASFQSFLCFIGGVEKHHYSRTSASCRRHMFTSLSSYQRHQ